MTKERRQQLAHVHDLVMAGAGRFISAGKLLRDSPTDVEATMLVNQFSPTLIHDLKGLADYNPHDLKPDELREVIGVGLAIMNFLELGT